MNKKRIVRISIFLGLVIIAVVFFRVLSSKTYSLYNVKENETQEAYTNLYDSLKETKKQNGIEMKTTYYNYLDEDKIEYGASTYDATLDSQKSADTFGYATNEVSLLSYDSSAVYKVDVKHAGYYYINTDYYVVGNPLTNYQIKVSIQGEFLFDEAKHISVPIDWTDSTKDFPLDSYGDQTLPKSNKIDDWTTLKMYDNQYLTTTPLLFYFDAGINTVKLTMISSNGSLALGHLSLEQPNKLLTYNEYNSNNTEIADIDKNITINAIDYNEKNSSFVRLTNFNSPVCEPFSNSQKKLNVVDGDSWSKSGQNISYTFNASTAGLYKLSLHYRNNKNEYDVFRSIYIDGNIPFSELSAYRFANTGSKYKTLTLSHSKNNPFKIYLSEGEHTITLKAEISPLHESLERLQLVVDHINQLALEVLKITGSDVDEDRTWDITRYIPETKTYLDNYDTELKGIANNLAKFSSKGINSSSIAFINRAIKLLQEIREKPGELPLYLDKLYSGTSSINQLLGDVIESISEQPMSLDEIYFNSKDNAPSRSVNGFVSFGNNMNQLNQTFFSDKYHQSISSDTIDVWVNKPITYIDVMQKLIDSEYNTTHDMKVKLSAMPDQTKLTMSVAAGNSPDVVLGVQSYIPYDLAIRGGVYDLSEFPDFWQVAGRFSPGSLLSFIISDDQGDRVYALPESLDFNVLAYRDDIFTSLDIDPNINTWQDAEGILTVLQRYGMNFYLPISADNSTKWFYQTTPMILQQGGSLYNSDGLSVAINQAEGVAGLEQLTSLFTEKSLPTSVPRFYSQFRSGTLPIGVLDFGTYLMLKNAAPEIAGKWKIRQPLGTKRVDKDGNEYIDRTYITSGTSGAIMQASEYKDEDWDFLKWWTSAEIQTKFGYNLQSTYGPEYLWLSSNLDAVRDSQIEQEDKEVILDSIKWITDVNRNPAQYIVERGLSNIWTATVLSGDPLRVKIENETITMNREIKRKMKEFGYIDSDGNVIKPFYIRDINWVKEQIQTNGGRS